MSGAAGDRGLRCAPSLPLPVSSATRTAIQRTVIVPKTLDGGVCPHVFVYSAKPKISVLRITFSIPSKTKATRLLPTIESRAGQHQVLGGCPLLIEKSLMGRSFLFVVKEGYTARHLCLPSVNCLAEAGKSIALDFPAALGKQSLTAFFSKPCVQTGKV